jgi:hypothetical protein
MSLIDEALRRARQEAARQDAARRDERYRQVPVLPPMASRRRSSSVNPVLVGAIVAACIVAGMVIGMFLGRGRENEATVADATPTAPAVESPLPMETPRPSIVLEETPETPEPETPKPTPTPAPVPTPEPPREVPASEAEPINPPPAVDVVPVSTPAPEPPPAETPPPAPVPEIRTYVREVPLPGGGAMRLNGIAFSSTKPVALIDDRVLGKGESYQGFLVTDIQAGMVELQGNGMTVRVSLK